MTRLQKYYTRARELRRKMTEEEKILWEKLRNRRFYNLKFLRQHSVIYDRSYNEPLFFVADFYCAEASLILEIDGLIHELQQEYDQQRDFVLKQKGVRVLRIKNDELKDLDPVKKKIITALHQ